MSRYLRNLRAPFAGATLLLAFAAVAAGPAQAQDTPTITVSKSDTIYIAITPLTGPDGAAATKVLQNDLALSGYFNITKPAGAAFIVTGASSGSSLEGRVADHSGGTTLAKSYSASGKTKAHEFADDIIETLTGNRGIANSKIAFVATRTGQKEIYLADYDGSGARQITHDSSISVGPRLSPDGSKLLYTGYKAGYADVYEIELGSGSRERIMKYPGTNTGAVFSPDGRRIAVTLSRDGNPELYVTASGGGGAQRLTRSPGAESSPTWSPDGNEIIYAYDNAGGPQLYRISAEGGSPRLLSTGRSYCTEPNWSPDGKKVAFNVRGGGDFEIAILDLASGSTRVLNAGGDAQTPSWGPDSRHLIFSQGGALCMLDAQTGRKVKILDGLGKITEPSWSR